MRQLDIKRINPFIKQLIISVSSTKWKKKLSTTLAVLASVCTILGFLMHNEATNKSTVQNNQTIIVNNYSSNGTIPQFPTSSEHTESKSLPNSENPKVVKDQSESTTPQAETKATEIDMEAILETNATDNNNTDSSYSKISNNPYLFHMDLVFDYTPVPEHTVTATNVDTGEITTLNAQISDIEMYEEKFAAGAYQISIDSDSNNLFSFIYKTNEAQNNSKNHDEYTYNCIVRLEYTPLFGRCQCEELSYEIQLENGEDPADMFLHISQPKYFAASRSMEFTVNSIDSTNHVAYLVIDRSYDKLYKLFYGFMNGETYYGVASNINEDGVLLVKMALPTPYPK